MDLAARRPGPDVTRALAMAGVVVMNYVGYSILRGAERGDGTLDRLFDPWTGPLSTRFAATFVVTAGVGVALMAERAGRERRSEISWRLASRGLVLYAGGLLFDFVWQGTILPFYGAMFVLAAGLVWLRSAAIIAIGVAAALTGWAIRAWRLERELDGISTSWLTDPGPRSPRGLVIDVMLNGTHPLLPWLAFFCAGIVAGRHLSHRNWAPVVAAIGFVLYFASVVVDRAAPSGRRASVLLSDDPFDRGLVYTASALGTALLATAVITAIADRYEHTPAIDALRRAGTLSLTVYLAHALLYNLAVDWLGIVEPRTLANSLVFALLTWTVITAAAIAYERRFGRGPAETVYRRLTV